MTGLECFQQEMMKRGCSKTQVESKAVAIALDILSKDSDCTFSLIREAKEEFRILKGQTERELKAAEHRKKEILMCYEPLWKQTREYIERFMTALDSCETPEGRDRIRAAQVYANTAILETKYDNTVYNNWMGALLCGATAFEGLSKIEKVNPKIIAPKYLGTERI